MSSSDDFILQWLNESLNIQPPIINISKEFSNGYKFAIVLNTLNAINSEELLEFKDTNNPQEIKDNFKMIKKYLHFKLNLDIREDEFNDVMNKDISKSVVILYKIKNSVHKKNINFLEIKTSDIKPSKEENIQKKEVYSKYTLRKMFDGNNDLNPIESIRSDLNKNRTKNYRNSKELNINTNLYNSNDIDANAQSNLDSDKNNFEYGNNRTFENNTFKRSKKFLPKIKIKSSIKYSFNNLDEQKSGTDFYNDYGMLKLNELRNKNNFEELKKKEKEKLLINKNNIFELKEKYKLDFLKKLNNPLYQFSKSTRIKLFSPINNKYNSYTKRYEYAKKFDEFKKRDDLNQQILNLKKSMNNNIDEINLKIILLPCYDKKYNNEI